MTEDLMGYERMAQEALRDVLRQALERAASPAGLPGKHHFYITFNTRAQGVIVAPRLMEAYPEEMTIVLEHQFWDLVVGQTGFEVSLKFSGITERLVVPYKAVTRFVDPHSRFGLTFEVPVEDEAQARIEIPQRAPLGGLSHARTVQPQRQDDTADAPAAVISLDAFRKK